VLLKCRGCGHDVSSEAATCPSCGAVRKRPTPAVAKGCLVLVAVGVGLIVFGAIAGRNDNTDTNAVPQNHYERVRGSADGPLEDTELVSVTDLDVRKGAAEQIAAAGYSCDDVHSLWAVQVTLKMQIKILKAQCSDGSQYQVTILDFEKKGFVKPWTGILLGN
jgi:hypothetical protein